MERTKSQISEKETLLIELLRSDGFLAVNKKLIKHVGLVPAVLLSNYIDKHVYFRKQHPENNGWFFLTYHNISEQLGLSAHQIRKAKKQLVENRYISTEMRGIPPKEWYTIHWQNLYTGIFLKKLKELPSRNLRNNIKDNKFKENKLKKINKKSNPSSETNNIPAHKTFINRFPQNWKDDTPFKKAARDFVLHRKQLGKSLTSLASKRLVTKLTNHNIQTATQALQASVENSWTGVFPESANNKTRSTKNRSGNHGGSDYYDDIDENEL